MSITAGRLRPQFLVIPSGSIMCRSPGWNDLPTCGPAPSMCLSATLHGPAHVIVRPACPLPASAIYDSQGFMVPASRGIHSVKELGGVTVCVGTGTTSELNLADYFAA